VSSLGWADIWFEGPVGPILLETDKRLFGRLGLIVRRATEGRGLWLGREGSLDRDDLGGGEGRVVEYLR